jgi:cytochrome c
MNAFSHERDFIRGPLYLFVYDTNGFQFASGLDEHYIWRNWNDQRDMFGTYMVREMIKKAKSGGGWLTYQWRNATKVSYVKLFTKDGKEYVIGAGYYPHSKRDIVIGLVKASVAYFDEVVNQKGFLVDEVFSTLSYPAGRFVMGDLYLYAVDFTGQMMANGDRPGLIGTNVLNVKDSEGKFVNQEIINRLKNSTEGVWVEYKSKNATKLAYAEKVTDKASGKQYFIAAGYYPTVTPEKAVDLVKDGYEFMKKHGLTAAVNEFSNRQTDSYRYGDLYLIVWDMKGKVIANGANLDAVGTNQWDLKDEDGKFFVQDLIAKADKGGGWVDVKLKNAFQSIYVEKVDLGTDSFVIGAGLYPISKREMAILLARSAAGYLRVHPEEEAFQAFTDPEGKFIRGDLYVFVIDFDGIAMVWGDNHELVWRNVMGAKDDAGKPYVQIFINTVKQGSGQVTYKINGRDRVALLEMVEKDGQNYVVGTAYYP